MPSILKQFRFLQLIILSAGVLILVVMGFIAVQMGYYSKRLDQVRDYQQGIFELTVLSQDFLQSGSERARHQWHSNYENLRKVLNELEQSLSSDAPEAIMLLATKDKDLQYLQGSFTDLERIKVEQKGNVAAKTAQAATNTLYLSQHLAASARQLEAFYSDLWRRKFLLLTLCAVSFLLGAKVIENTSIARLRKRTKASLAGFHEALSKIRHGQRLKQRNVVKDDEFGVILREFETVAEFLHEKYQELTREIDSKNAKLEEADTAKNRFLANVSHEIRTPLSIIDGYAAVLKDAPLEVQEEYIAKVRWNVDFVLGLINEILDLSKVEAGKMELQVASFRTSELAQVISSLKRSAESKKLKFSVDGPGRLPAIITSDRKKLEQILMNVVGNAIKFTDFGRVELFITSAGCDLEISVSDTGRGISPQSQQKLFTMFYRSEDQFNLNKPGTGLGLALSQRMARLLGGDIRLVESSAEMGSTFAINIKLDGVDATETIAPSDLLAVKFEEKKLAVKKRLCGVKILLAEDSPDLRKLMEFRIAMLGGEVTAVEDGRAALAEILVAGKHFDLVLLDIQMPVLDGYAVVRRLRTMGYQKPVVACSARLMQEERQRGKVAGFDDYLEKPVAMERLVELCERLNLLGGGGGGSVGDDHLVAAPVGHHFPGP